MCTDRHSCQSKIGEGRLIFVILLVESDRHLVYDAVLAVFPYFSFYRLRFSTMYIVVLNDLLDKYIRPRPFGYVKPVKPKKGKKSEKEAQA